MELLPFVDILKVFNNPISEEQAWAVCYQCALFLSNNAKQENYQIMLDYGVHSIWLSRQGDVFLRKGPPDPNGSGKGPPDSQRDEPGSQNSSTILSKRKRNVIATEYDAVQALGTAIFQALDYGIDACQERQLSQGLESLILAMTSSDCSLEDELDALNADDEGIEKDADLELRCTILEVIKLCSQHLSSRQDCHHHYKAVCRALATEAGELFTFLDRIASCKEKLSDCSDEDSKRLEELQRADWACLWVQVMRSLRQGVLLKKVEHVHLPPLEYELTPFEMLLEDIRSRRYTLHKIMVDGEIPSQVKSDAHAFILDFIRSRPPLKKVTERVLKPKPPPTPDPYERLLKEIRSKPKLKPVRGGRLVVETLRSGLVSEQELGPPAAVKRVIKPDLNLLLDNSFDESSEDEDHSPQSYHHTSVVSDEMAPPLTCWQKSTVKDAFQQDTGQRPTRLQRRHTIMVCESPVDGKVAPQELPPLEEEEEPSPVRESHHLSHLPLSRKSQTVLARSCYSDNDLSNQVTLRHAPGHLRRSSLEHRRSLTSLTTGLSAIPEIEDVSLTGTDSPAKSAAFILRSFSHEQAPPPNPSPPCKGRARAGMGMAGMKSFGAPYHPTIYKSHPSLLSDLPSTTNQRTSHGMMITDSGHTSPVADSQHLLVSPDKHPSALSSSIQPPTLSSSSLQSSLSLPSSTTSLDPTVSSQSPTYLRKFRASQNQPCQNGGSSAQSQPSTDRWRSSINSEIRLNTRTQQVDEQIHRDFYTGSDCRTFVAKDGIPLRRRSLDSGMGLNNADNSKCYSNFGNGHALEATSRRRSLEVKATRQTEKISTLKNFESLEDEEERLSRWRNLHADEISSGKRKVGRDPNNQQHSDTSQTTDYAAQTQLPHHLSSDFQHQQTPQPFSHQPLDVFEQNLSKEEARLTRWRHLEEAVGEMSGSAGEHNGGLPPPDRNPDKGQMQSLKWASDTPGVASLHGTLPLHKRWQNPVECLSLTLEEVTHIRSVLTKAELESLISHPDLYQQVSRSKLCFTCKTTRFTLFGEWGTKCKFCKRTVCSRCLRKMNVPSEQFQLVPVYSLSPTMSPDTQELVQNFIRAANPMAPSQPPATTRSGSLPSAPSMVHQEQASQSPETSSGAGDDISTSSQGFFNRKPLHRSQSLFVPGQKPNSPRAMRASKGVPVAICCDCKGMVKEIVRATQTTVTMISTPALTIGKPTIGTNTKHSRTVNTGKTESLV